jgi:hypothetical protein
VGKRVRCFHEIWRDFSRFRQGAARGPLEINAVFNYSVNLHGSCWRGSEKFVPEPRLKGTVRAPHWTLRWKED